MNTSIASVIGGALLALSAVSAQADCAADLARMAEGSMTAGEGIAKDGSLAPLEGAASGSAATTATAAGSAEGIAKDGSHTPLESGTGQQPGVAMSGSDVEAQQEGKPTAAEQADKADSSGRDGYMEKAHAALVAGNEEECMKHLKDAEAS